MDMEFLYSNNKINYLILIIIFKTIMNNLTCKLLKISIHISLNMMKQTIITFIIDFQLFIYSNYYVA